MSKEERQNFYFEEVLQSLRDPKTKFTHVTTKMISEQQMNHLKTKFTCVKVPSGCWGTCYMVCK